MHRGSRTAHPEHLAVVGADTIRWENPDFTPPQKAEKTKKQRIVDEIRTERDLAEIAGLVPVEPKRLPSFVRHGRPSSVAPDDPRSRMEGSERATKALEPEFEAAALEAVRVVGKVKRRLTSDDLWDWLDANQHFTEHPKGMTGLLRRFVSMKLIEPVPDDMPDHQRPSRRSNKSRNNRVYIYIGDSS